MYFDYITPAAGVYKQIEECRRLFLRGIACFGGYFRSPRGKLSQTNCEVNAYACKTAGAGQTVRLSNPVSVVSYASIGGKLEAQGPPGGLF